MSRKKDKGHPVPVLPIESLWDVAIGTVASLIAVLVPFLPDEKIVRIKLEGLELGVFVLALLVGCRAILNGSFRINALRITVLAWAAINGALWFFSEEKSLATPELRRVVLAASAFLVFSFSDMPVAWRRRFILSWAVGGSVMALYGILQFSGGIGPVMVPQMDRVIGTYGNPIFFAVFLVTAFFVTLAALSSERSTAVRWFLGIGLFLQTVACYHTQTRAAWLAFAAAFMVGFLAKFGRRRVRLWVWILAIILGGVFVFQTKRVWTRDQGHLLIWRDTLRMWKDHPVAGVGLGAFHTNFPAYAQSDLTSKWPVGQVIVNDAHNEYLQTLSETGLIGFVCFLLIPVLFFLRQRPVNWLGCAVLSIFFQNFFSVDMRFVVSLVSCFMLMGLLDSDSAGEPCTRDLSPIRLLVAVAWAAFLLALVLPKLLKPYRAQKEVAAAVNFFDQKLLDPAKSTADLEALAQQYPKEPSILEKLAYVYAKQIRLVDNKLDGAAARKAVETYQRLIALDPKRVAAYNNMANIFYTMGNVDQALSTWGAAVQVDPNFIDAQLNLGKILYTRGELKKAAAHFEKVLQTDPNNAEAIVYLKRMVE